MPLSRMWCSSVVAIVPLECAVGCGHRRDLAVEPPAHLSYTAPDHVVDQSRVEAGALGERAQDYGAEAGGMYAGQASVALAERGTHCLDDDCVAHGSAFRWL